MLKEPLKYYKSVYFVVWKIWKHYSKYTWQNMVMSTEGEKHPLLLSHENTSRFLKSRFCIWWICKYDDVSVLYIDNKTFSNQPNIKTNIMHATRFPNSLTTHVSQLVPISHSKHDNKTRHYTFCTKKKKKRNDIY